MTSEGKPQVNPYKSIDTALLFGEDPLHRNTVCFDLEGPISPMDCAYELMALIPNGRRIFEAISYYDDMMCGLVIGRELWKKEGYEAGETLRLIVPNLVYHGITEETLLNISSQATLVPGVKELINSLHQDSWNVRIITTSYEQHAHNIGSKIGLKPGNIFCTKLPLPKIRKTSSKDSAPMLRKVEKSLSGFNPEDFGTAKDEELKTLLDRFFLQELPQTRLGEALKSVEVMGGAKKAWSLERIAKANGGYIEQMAFIGDSITDTQAVQVTESLRGLATAFNGNEYVIPYSTIGLAGLEIIELWEILKRWRDDGRTGLQEWVRGFSQFPDPNNLTKSRIQWITGVDIGTKEEYVLVHKYYRKQLKGLAAKLG